MKIDNAYQEQLVNQINQTKRQSETSDLYSQTTEQTSVRDSFEMTPVSETTSSEDYSDFAKMLLAQIQASTGTEETEEDSDVESVTSSISDIISNISDTMSASEETVLSTLDSLGLKPDDLLDSSNVEAVVTALNSGAEALGLPTVDSLDDAISSITSVVEDSVASIKEDLSLSDEDYATLLEEVKSYLESGATENVMPPMPPMPPVPADDDTTDEDTTTSEAASTTTSETVSTTSSETASTIESLDATIEEAIAKLKEELGLSDEDFEKLLSSADAFRESIMAYASQSIQGDETINASNFQRLFENMQDSEALNV